MEKITIEVEDYGKVSDGYHTIEELYDHRITLYIALCWAIFNDEENDTPVWRSKIHSDGSSYDGWYILGLGKEKNSQITYHIPLARWNDTDFLGETLEKAPEWDGHTSADVLARLNNL